MLIVGIVLYSLMLWVMNDFSLLNDKFKTTSLSYRTLEVIPAKAGSLILDLKPIFQRYWDLIQDSIKENQTPPPPG